MFRHQIKQSQKDRKGYSKLEWNLMLDETVKHHIDAGVDGFHCISFLFSDLRNEFNSYPNYTSVTWVGAVDSVTWVGAVDA